MRFGSCAGEVAFPPSPGSTKTMKKQTCFGAIAIFGNKSKL